MRVRRYLDKISKESDTKQRVKTLTSKSSSHSRKTSVQEQMSKVILRHSLAKSVADTLVHKE